MRTPEQKAADEALDRAIRGCMDAYGHTGLVVGTVTLAAVVEYEDDGQHSGICRYVPEDQHWIMTLGVLDGAQTILRDLFRGGSE